MLLSTKAGAAFVGLSVLYATLMVPLSFGQTANIDHLKILVKELHTKGARADVTTLDKTAIRGRIVRLAEVSRAEQN